MSASASSASVVEIAQMLDECIPANNYTERLELILYCVDNYDLLLESEMLTMAVICVFRLIIDVCDNEDHCELLTSFVELLEEGMRSTLLA
jgi:hypothetical protein